MTDLVDRRDLEELIEPRPGPCVSIALPTHRAGPATQQDPIRLKNLLADAEEALDGAGVRSPDAAEILAPAREMLDDEAFWRYQADGLLLYLAPGWWRAFRVPLDVPELAVVTDRFHVKPLLRLLSGDGRFYVLALSENEIRLFEGTRQRIDGVDLDEVPTSLREALRYDDPEKERLFHVTGRAGGAAAIFHGHGVGGEVEKERIARYLRLVDAGIGDALGARGAPLVLAGVDHVRAIYRSVSRYPTLLQEGVAGNPDHLRAEELHTSAWALVEPVFRRERDEAAARYREMAGTGLAIHDLSEALPAARHGRVDVAFVAVGEHRWGAFSDSDAVVVRDDPAPGDEDLLDLAAVLTLVAGGTVHAVAPEDVPGEGPLAAILRY